MSKKHLASATRASALPTFLAAAFIALTVGFAAEADEVPQSQSWVPEALEMPEDIEMLTDREIGSSLRMFSFSTSTDVDELLEEWEEALRLAGYIITQAQVETLERVIEFSGPGISNAKIAVTPSLMDDRTVIEFDATLM